MEKEEKRNNRKYIITFILSIIVIISSITTIFYIKDKKSDVLNKKYYIESTNVEKNKELKQKEEELKTIISRIESYNNLDELIASERKEYFNAIKKLEDAILAGKSDKKIAYLTFDDGPYYNTYKVLDILDKYNVKATFFLTNINGEKCFDKKSENCYS